jgi:bilirubin oxidase
MKSLIGLILQTFFFLGQLSAQVMNWIPVPDTLSGETMSLHLHQGTMGFFDGPLSPTLGVNQYNYLGPTLVMNRGQWVTLEVNNDTGDTTNLHWHGLHVPAAADGPSTMLMDGMMWSPSFEVMNDAGTYWYHAHYHKKTGLHALKGLAGFIVVRDNEEAALPLPRSYGEDDFPLVFQSIQYDSLNVSMPRGMQDSTVFVNGVRANYGYTANLNVPAQCVRFRLLNGSGERSFLFGFENNAFFDVIASDAGLLQAPVHTNRIRLSPGERAEVVVNFSGSMGQEWVLQCKGSELPMGVQGGPTMPMPEGSPPMDSPLNGVDYPVMHLWVQDTTSSPVWVVPAALASFDPWLEQEAALTRTIEMSALDPLNMDGPFYFNNQLFDMDRIDFYIPVDQTEIWQLHNQTMVAHPFHLHDVHFFILDRDGVSPPPVERGKKDVLLIEPNETVRFIAKFDTFWDTLVPYMHHCHILMHEDDGMMGQFLVVPPGFVEVNELQCSTTFSVFPNPGKLAHFPVEFNAGMVDVRVFSAEGQRVFQKNGGLPSEAEMAAWPCGTYTLAVRKDGQFHTAKWVKMQE